MAEQTNGELPNLPLLIKLLKMTTSPHDGEALLAVRKANEQLVKFGGCWEALLRGKVTIIADPFANEACPPPPPDRKPAPPAPPRPPRQPPPFTAPPRPAPPPKPRPVPPQFLDDPIFARHPVSNQWTVRIVKGRSAPNASVLVKKRGGQNKRVVLGPILYADKLHEYFALTSTRSVGANLGDLA
jgi:hypothetical protein